MCTIFVIRDQLADHPMVIAANRDEMLDRPWSAPRLVGERPRIVMPRDDDAGGTWIGLNDAGLLVAITNRLFWTMDPARPSRGILCRDALSCDDLDAALAMVRAAISAAVYNGFNLLLADAGRARVLIYGDGELREVELDGGVHVITSTHDLDPPELAPLRDRVRRAATEAAGDLERFEALAASVLSDHELIGPRYTVCKHGETFGTRSAAIMALSANGAPRFRFAAGQPCETPFSAAPMFAAEPAS